jgi:hypothetical protein
MDVLQVAQRRDPQAAIGVTIPVCPIGVIKSRTVDGADAINAIRDFLTQKI